METMKIMQSRNVYSKKVQIPKQLHEKFSYLDFEDSKSLFSLDGLLDGSSESRGQAGAPATLSVLPGGFWPHTSPHVMRDAVDASRQAARHEGMKVRLDSKLPFRGHRADV